MAETFIDQLRGVLRTFRTAQHGNVAITFALAIVPIMAAVGAAVDYSRANSTKAAMQAAVDSTALMLSKEAQSLTTAQLNDKANAYFKALFNRTEAKDIVITPKFTIPQQGSFRLDVTGAGTVPTAFGALIGQSRLDISVNSEVQWGMRQLELALALDNTGSMASSNKMTELKKAAKSLLKTLKDVTVKAGDVKVAIIPFDTKVKIGTSYKNTNWIDWTEWDSQNGTCSKSQQNGDKKDKEDCERRDGTWTASSHDNWQGCIMDRDQPNDTLDTTPGGATSTKFPATQCGGDLVQLLPLTDIHSSNGYDSVKNTIDAMKPDGNTNVTIGLEWAWHALTKNLALDQAAPPKPDELDKVIILLTDGDNTENRWESGRGADKKIDARTKAACTNLKNEKTIKGERIFKLYTIKVINGNAELLKECASAPASDHFFEVESAGKLDDVFTTIAKSLARLHIAR